MIESQRVLIAVNIVHDWSVQLVNLQHYFLFLCLKFGFKFRKWRISFEWNGMKCSFNSFSTGAIQTNRLKHISLGACVCVSVYEWIEWDGKLQTWRRILFSNQVMSIENFCKCLKKNFRQQLRCRCMCIYLLHRLVAKQTEIQKLSIIPNVCCLSCFFLLLFIFFLI